MAIINQATKELQVKIVYYGPAMGGKTTNLVQVHDHVQTQAGNKGKLVSLATSSDRTLFFDFLPIEAMTIKGFKTKFQLYTVPGQVIYNTTRQLVLRGVDGIVALRRLGAVVLRQEMSAGVGKQLIAPNRRGALFVDELEAVHAQFSLLLQTFLEPLRELLYCLRLIAGRLKGEMEFEMAHYMRIVPYY